MGTNDGLVGGSRLHPLAGEDLQTFAAAARLVPSRRGGTACPSTLWRWSTAGARAPDGRRIQLERVRIGATWYTSREAVERFLAALNTPAPHPHISPPRTPVQRQRAADQAGRVLDQIGM
jgi:hypothetical protein